MGDVMHVIWYEWGWHCTDCDYHNKLLPESFALRGRPTGLARTLVCIHCLVEIYTPSWVSTQQDWDVVSRTDRISRLELLLEDV